MINSRPEGTNFALPTQIGLFVMVGFLSVLMAILRPPFQAPDEFHHYFQSVAVFENWPLHAVEGDSLRGVYIEREHVEFANQYNGIAVNYDEKISGFSTDNDVKFDKKRDIVFVESPGTNSYFPAIYAPNYVFYRIGRLLSDDLLMNYRFVNVANALLLLVSLAIGLFLLRSVINFTLLIFVVSSPLYIFQSSSWSVDAFYHVFAFVFCAICISNLGRVRKFWWLNAIVVLISLAKLNFALFFLPILSLLRRKRELLIVVLGSVAILFWAVMTVNSNIKIPGQPGIASENVVFILENKIFSFVVFIKELINPLRLWNLMQHAAGVLGWLDYSVSPLLRYVYGLIFGALIVAPLSLFRKLSSTDLLLYVAVIMSWPVVNGLLFVGWSHIPSGVILGVQGRYFFPMLIVCALLLGKYYYAPLERLSGSIAVQLGAVLLVFWSGLELILSTVERYY